ncbi:MAG: DUF3015 domain-containing protein [Gammaproteobacteria bacterium]|nr:DUF3015 domain-containing protein [Gammaproteobacteria bacterium]
MKRVILIATMLASLPMLSQAASRGAGCGVGAVLFDGQTGTVPHVLAATTNGSLFDTVSMTFGIMGCDTSVSITASADEFLKDNIDKVARDMSSGQGESLETLANLLRIDDADKSRFFSATQKNFGRIFSREDISSIEVLETLAGVMKEDVTLSKYFS